MARSTVGSYPTTAVARLEEGTTAKKVRCVTGISQTDQLNYDGKEALSDPHRFDSQSGELEAGGSPADVDGRSGKIDRRDLLIAG